MNIKIKSITLRNFKGLRDVSFDFDGRNATIIGDNGTGKTTIFDALTWVLFGKDSHNSTDIDIKTIDATGEPMHRAEHFVEVALDVDGSTQTLRRTYREIWSKPRGSSDLRFVGHESAFAVNGVEVGTKTAYDKIISEWINDDVFRMLTDPMYFNTRVDWKGRRAALLALVGDNIDRTAIQAQFADLLAEMNGEPPPEFQAAPAGPAPKKKKKELDTFAPKIEAYQNTMPPTEDYTALEQEIVQRESVAANEIVAYQRQIDALDAQIANASKIDEETQAAHDRRLKKVLDIKKSLSECIDARLTAARRYNSDRDAAIMDAQEKADSILREIEKTETTANSKRDTLEACVKKQANIKSALDTMRAKYEAEKKAAFEYVDTTTCYACGQPLPTETIEEARRAARESFEKHQREILDKLIADANLEKDTYSKLTKLVSTTEQEIAMLDQRLSQLRAEHHAATLAITTAKDVPAIDLETEEEQAKLSPAYRKLTEELTREQAALETSATTKITAATLTARRRDISAQIDTVRQNLATATADLRRRLANKERTTEIQRLIDETKATEKKIAERIAELERLEFAAAAYTKADIEAVEAAINSRFDLVRWRMYEQTIEGADVETCVATIDGVPFNSLNSAGQVLAGLDIIRTFCRYYGATAPVFIDNAESISQTDFALDSQVIRLQVVEGAALELKTA
jgi:DNA repair exonuclease SbcCD ATPase subunit